METIVVNNISSSIFYFCIVSQNNWPLVMKLIRSCPKWVGEAISYFHDSRRNKTFYRQVRMRMTMFIINPVVSLYMPFISLARLL